MVLLMYKIIDCNGLRPYLRLRHPYVFLYTIKG